MICAQHINFKTEGIINYHQLNISSDSNLLFFFLSFFPFLKQMFVIFFIIDMSKKLFTSSLFVI